MKTQKISVCLSVITLLSMTGCDAESFFNGTSSSNTAEQVAQATPATVVEEHGISADTAYKTIGDEDGVLFETALNEEDIAGEAEVGLYDDTHSKIADLYDDGSHGDRVAGDGIYGCRYVPNVAEEAQKEYSIKIGDYETDPTSIRFFDPISEEDLKASEQTGSTLEASISDLMDAEGNVPKEKQDEAIEKLRAVADELQLSGEIVEYRVNSNNNLVAKLSSGITYIQDLQLAGYDQGHCDRDITVWTCQPCKAGYPANVSANMAMPDQGATALDNAFDNVNFTSNLDDGSVTLNTVRSFTSNQIVLWHGHGGYDEKLHSYILTGHTSASGTLSSQDLVEDRVVLCGNVYAFTYKFVDAYCGDLSGSLIYLGTCFSGKDGVLANSFLNKNCDLYIGNSDSIYTTYNTSMIKSFAEYLAEEKKFLFFIKTGHRTASEAMAEAKKDNGQDDGSNLHAKPLLFGKSSYILNEMSEEEASSAVGTTVVASGSISLDTTYVSIGVGEKFTVNVTSYPTGYSASDFTWTVDNSKVASISNGTITGVSAGSTILTIKSKDNKFSQSCAVSVH